MNTILKIILGVAFLVIVGLIVSSAHNKDNLTNEEISENKDASLVENPEDLIMPETTTIQLPLTAVEATGDFGPFGCGAYINFHTIEIPQTSQVLNAVYTELFELPYENIKTGVSDKNIIASQEMLEFNSVELIDGDAKVYLTGTVMGNHCADEVFRHQIEQAAFQFDTVDSITVFVNDEIFDWCDISDADASESGCDINPRLWMKERE